MMVDAGSNLHGRRWLRYVVAGVLCVVGVWTVSAGLHWYWAIFIICLAFVVAIGRRTLFRAGVSRTPHGIVCRYIPWYEGSAYFLNLGLPLMAVAMISASYDPSNPVWLRFGGIILLILMPIVVYSYVTMWRGCSLEISPSALTVRLAASKDGPIELSRGRVRSIEPRMVPNSVSGARSLQAEISYSAVEESADVKTVLLGLQFTVEPHNLLDALVAWKDNPGDDPDELMDRIERILVGRS